VNPRRRRTSLRVPRTRSANTQPQPSRADVAIVIALYAVSTAVYALLGVHFDGLGAMVGMQFIDPELLKERLFESLWYYHASPPGLNLIAGIGLKLFGQQADWFYTTCFHILGLLVTGAVYLLTWKLSASRIAAAITTGLLVFSPQFVLYENWLFYSFPSMALLTLATFALYKFAETGRQRWCAGIFAMLGLLLMTRSLFHPSWLAGAGHCLARCDDVEPSPADTAHRVCTAGRGVALVREELLLLRLVRDEHVAGARALEHHHLDAAAIGTAAAGRTA